MKRNIAGVHVNDKNYRYKRDSLIIKYIKVKGGQTEITNLDKVSKQLHIKDTILFAKLRKHFGIAGQGNLLNTIISLEKLEEAIDYISKRDLLCANCHLPELDSKGRCKACSGNKGGKIRQPKEEDDEIPKEEQKKRSRYF